MKHSIGLKGRVKVSVIDAEGKTVHERPWQRNLLLDQGLNQLAETTLADLFLFAARGTGTTATKEVVSTGNAYALVGATLTRTGGAARDFTGGDVGKLVRITSSPFTEGIIQGFTDANNVTLRAVGQGALADYSNKDIEIYNVNQVGLAAEVDRTNTYGAASGDNSATNASNVRTYQRTFIFDPTPEQLEDIADTNAYSRSGTTVARDIGTRDFTPADVGKYLYFDDAEVLTKITAFTDAQHVTVAGSGVISTQTAKLYGFVSYGEIGFSHLEAAGNNLNIRIRLEDGAGASDPVPVEGANPETPGQQLKVAYQLEVTLEPNTSTPGTAAITDSGNDMSANKNGDYCIEQIALSGIGDNGDSELVMSGVLEPSIPGEVGFSPSAAAIVALNGPDRSADSTSVPLVNDSYEEDSFTIVSEGTFALGDALATNWRTLGIFDTTSEQFPFVFVFDAAQTKDSDHVITLRFRKTWNRDLS